MTEVEAQMRQAMHFTIYPAGVAAPQRPDSGCTSPTKGAAFLVQGDAA